MAEAPHWIDLLDPSSEELRSALPCELHSSALELLSAPPTHEDEPRPRLDGQGDYVFGVFLVAVAVREQDRVYYQEIDLVITPDTILTVRKTPKNEVPFDTEPVKQATHPNDSVGMIAYRLVDEIAEKYLDLIDDLNEEIEELDDNIESWKPERIRRRIAQLRHDMLHIRRTLAPTRDGVREVVDDRVDIETGTLFPRDVEVAFGSAYDKLLRASEGLDFSRDLLGSVRDYYLAKVATDQNEVVKRLTVVASLLLVPTFIVGVYGQNFTFMPEINDFGGWGYLWSWFLIVATTVLQLWYFRRKRWI
jgi:magnesium transporter